MTPTAGGTRERRRDTKPYRRRRYQGGEGMWSWILHRGSGLFVLGFLFLHILDTALIGFGKHHYDSIINIYKKVWFQPLEVILVGAVIYHSLNGLRVILIDFWDRGAAHERQLALATNLVSAALFIPSAIIMLKPYV
ncbi:MAG TPA: succinate dehydrogenase, cytochrome b556 subunit [Actinomycetota bacterium]|nr:succinate dehydrogenase, cytochrome b556 subunit [Actinomycetota bacterium]